MIDGISKFTAALSAGCALALSPAAMGDILVLDAVADIEIDSSTAQANNNQNSVNALNVGLTATSENWVMIAWDLSSIATNAVVSDVTFQIKQVDTVAGSVDVYAIDQGEWSESVVTWNSWAATTTSLTQLGTMANATLAGGNSVFSDDDLKALVQGWVDGGHDNLGILLKWSGAAIGGDNYLSREHPGAINGTYIPPQLVVTYEVPEPATLGLMLAGGVLICCRRRRD